MAYSELIKNFDRIRDYMRDFFIYGFKGRSAFDRKSGRTYDNERRRIENYLGDYIGWDYSKNGKCVFISVDTTTLQHNPLHKAFKAKSFTDNDIQLHFFILDVLSRVGELSVEQIADSISLDYGLLFDPQTVRIKCKEYVDLGLLKYEKQGKAHTFSLSPYQFDDLLNIGESFSDMISFFSEAAQFSEIGSYLLDRLDRDSSVFLFKHHFLSHPLEDIVLMTAVNAIEQHRSIEFTNVKGTRGASSTLKGYPLKVYTSTQTGRQYLIVRGVGRKRFTACRLDYIKSVKLFDECEKANEYIDDFNKRKPHSFGISISAERAPEHIAMTLYIDDRTEQHIIRRLKREGKGGKIEKIDENTYLYSIDVYDTNEMMRWIKTFTGRIIKLEGDNIGVINRFYGDMRRMADLYGGQG